MTSKPTAIEVSLSESHLKRVANCDPALALVELIWNGLDAGATNVEVLIATNELGGVTDVQVKDNGSGISPEEVKSAFGSLGESLKTKSKSNLRGHRVHGSLGEGRFKAYSLGNEVEWVTRNGNGRTMRILGRVEEIRKFHINSKPAPDSSTGTHFLARNGYGDKLKLPSAEKLVDRLSVVFAPKLLAEKEIQILINGTPLNPQVRIDTQETTDLIDFPNTKVKTVIWKPSKARMQQIVWCDDGFNSRSTEDADISAGVDCSVFVASPEVTQAVADNTFELRETTVLGQIKEKSIEVAQEFINRTTKAKISKTVHELKQRGVYPYDGTPRNDLDSLERNVFDVCATKVIESLPAIASGSKERQRLTLHLLRTALESSPTSVQHIFERILKLPKEQMDELANILGRVSIAGLIRLGKLVVDRRDALNGIEQILFEKENRKRLLERTQLHKIIEAETWIFGEEFSLGCSDETLNTVLQHHQHLLKHDEDTIEYVDGSERGMCKIPDLVLSRQYKYGAADQYKHLIVELKRPKVTIGFDEKTQIEKYAAAISSDPRFDKSKTRWVFVAVSNAVSDDILDLFQSSDGRLDPGKNPNIEIYVKPWNSILQAAKGRMDYLWQRTEALSSRGDGLSYLKEKYPDIMTSLQDVALSSEAS